MEGLIGHERIVRFFTETLGKGHCTHAYLFSGPLSVGKTTLIERLTKRMLCTAGSGDDTCDSCRAHAKGQHPDFSLFDPDVFIDPKTEEHPKIIKIDYVRAIERWASLKPLLGRVKIQGIVHADRLNTEAANALLKLLEDPPSHTIFFLAAEYPARLPATVRSRVASFRLAPVPVDSCTHFLEQRGIDADRAARIARLARGSLGLAVRLAEDAEKEEALMKDEETWIALLTNPLGIFQAEALLDYSGDRLLFFLSMGQALLHDLLRMRGGVSVALRRQYGTQQCARMSRKIIEAMRLLHTNVSSKLVLENLFLFFTSPS